MKITSHCLVRNEENFIWYVLNSILNYVDEVLVWDMGSEDHSVEIIKSVDAEKIKFREIGNVDSDKISSLRQEMLDQTDPGWIFVLDGDEVWWDDSIRLLLNSIKQGAEKLDSIVVPFYSLVGDLYHFQDESAGKYSIDGRTGHLTIKAINTTIPGLSVQKPYGKEGYFDGDGIEVQKREASRRFFLKAPFLHATHLKRSSKDEKVIQRPKKFKYELGKKFPFDFYYPEVFFRPKPKIVPSLWSPMSINYRTRAIFETPLKLLKRRIT